jgi:hypothetical protein
MKPEKLSENWKKLLTHPHDLAKLPSVLALIAVRRRAVLVVPEG